MATQAQIDALTARLQVVATNVKTLEDDAAANAASVDTTALEAEITAVEAQVNAGLPQGGQTTAQAEQPKTA